MPKTPREYVLTDEKEAELREIARKLRIDIIKMIHSARSGHPGGSLSVIDWLTVLFFDVMRHRPGDPAWPDRDRFILSKGHASPALYACLAESGYIDKKELKSFRRLDSRLQGHPERAHLDCVEVSTGSLGQGLAVANGMALGCRLDNRDNRVFVVNSDGEMQAGILWESVMSGAHFGLENVLSFVDNNNLQIDGNVDKIMSIYPLPDKWRASGWNVIEIDGHDIKQMYEALNNFEHTTGRPTVIVAGTVKGKGVSFMEGAVRFHGVPPNDEELEAALEELGAAR